MKEATAGLPLLRTVTRAGSPVGIVALFVGIYCLNLFVPRDLWVQDEPRYGEVVREMLQSGAWLIPQLNGYPYPDKPPLYFWLVAAIGGVVGQGELAFRLLSTLSTALALAGVFLVARALAGARVALWTSVIFLTTVLTLIVGQIVRMDMLLGAASVFAWYALIRHQTTASRRSLIGFWLCSALGVGIKGPIALLFTLLPAFAWVVLARGLKGLLSLRPLTGLAGLAAMVFLWVGAVYATGHGDYLASIWHKQLVGRAVNAWSHKEPLYFYVVLLPLLMMPWTALVVRGGYILLREHLDYWTLIACFTLLPLLGLSLISGKLFVYLQPLVPGLCLAAGVAADRLAREPGVSRWLSWPPLIFFAAVSIGIGWLAWAHLEATRWAGFLAALLLLALAGAGIFAARWHGQRWLYAWAAALVVVSWILFGLLAFAINPLWSPRPLGELIAAQAAPDTAVGVVNTTRGIFNYYAGRTMTELDVGEAASWWRVHPQAFLIVKTDDLAQVFGPSGVAASCQLHQTYRIALKDYHVVGRC